MEKLILARRRVNPLEFRRVSAALLRYWRDVEGADHVATQARLERDILPQVPVNERTFRSVLHQWCLRGVLRREQAGPTTLLYRVAPDVPNPLWRRYCPALEGRLEDPIVLAGRAGAFYLVGRMAHSADPAAVRWRVPTHRLHIGAWTWAHAWQCAATGGLFASPNQAVAVAAESAQRAIVELVSQACRQPAASTLQARVLGAIRRTPACRPLSDFGSYAPHVARRPARLAETARQALWAVEEASGTGPAGHSGLRAAWLARLRSLVRRNVLKDASPAARDGSAIGSGRQEELDGDVRRMPAEVRATLRQSERAWGLQGLQSAARELG